MAVAKKKCKHCSEYEYASIGVKTPVGFFCSSEHMMEFIKEKRQRQIDKGIIKQRNAAKEKAKKERKVFRERKEKLKTVGDYTKEAQASINKYIRLRDSGKPCISCGSLPEQKLGGTMDAGHYRSRGSAGHLRFNVFNIHAQCVKCNRYNSGNAVDYRISLIKKIGLERVERLENDNSPRKFTIEYLKRVKKIFNKKYRVYAKRFRN